MKISEIVENITRYLTEAFARIFGPGEEESPPEIGVQPFEGDLYHE